jgi:hypothetical protein
MNANGPGSGGVRVAHPLPDDIVGTPDMRHAVFGEEIGIAHRSTSSSCAAGLTSNRSTASHDLITNVTGGDPHLTAKIALAHLNESPDAGGIRRSRGSSFPGRSVGGTT